MNLNFVFSGIMKTDARATPNLNCRQGVAKAEIFGLVTQRLTLCKMDLGTLTFNGTVVEIQGSLRSCCHPHISAVFVTQPEIFAAYISNIQASAKWT